MTKKVSTSNASNKVTFGKKTVGQLKKKFGPKEKPKKYRGQGK
jgi:hypothetical protein